MNANKQFVKILRMVNTTQEHV